MKKRRVSVRIRQARIRVQCSGVCAFGLENLRQVPYQVVAVRTLTARVSCIQRMQLLLHFSEGVYRLRALVRTCTDVQV